MLLPYQADIVTLVCVIFYEKSAMKNFVYLIFFFKFCLAKNKLLVS